MAYDFSNLSHVDFEDLARELLGAELRLRFEAFGMGPDGGIDGRHSVGPSSTILQVKHLVGSSFSKLLGTMRKERSNIDRLSPSRYILATSRALSPANKRQLAAAIGPSLNSERDIYSPSDLNALLRSHPEIEKAHVKLWLSSAAVLSRILHASAHAHAAITMEEIRNKVRVYVPNPSFSAARMTLDAHHVLIISGPPGVGKTTLAEMMTYTYLADGWTIVPIRNLDDGFAAIIDTEKQIFFFDDFLGRIALDKHALASKDSDLARFFSRVRKSPNARFILTTRAYIFEEARRISENLSDNKVDVSKYVLDVGVYTRRIKARILYNHLLGAQAPPGHIKALIESGKIPKIVDHAHYNPRIIERMCDRHQIGQVPESEYANSFVFALDNPDWLWDTAFRTHIPEKCRHLLYAMFFGSEYGENISDIQRIYRSLHLFLSNKYTHPSDAKDFEEAVRILEGSFIKIYGHNISFINPSLRDYLTKYLADRQQLNDLAAGACQAGWARALWWHGEKKIPAEELPEFAQSFLGVARSFPRLPTRRKSKSFPNYYESADLAYSDRVSLLIRWWDATKNDEFARLATDIAANPTEGFDASRDGPDLVELVADFRMGLHDGFPYEDEILNALTSAAVSLLRGGLSSEDLERISDRVESYVSEMPAEIVEASATAIESEFTNLDEIVSEIDSESTLDEYKEALSKLAMRGNIPEKTLETSIQIIDRRRSRIVSETEEALNPSYTGPKKTDREAFDDRDLTNLFSTLLQR